MAYIQHPLLRDRHARRANRGPGPLLNRLVRLVYKQRIFVLALLPTLVAALYYGFIAADQYEAESRFIVRSATKPESNFAISTLVQLGLGRSQDDAYAVQEFLTSRDATVQLRSRLPVEAMYHADGADFVARYPSFIYGRTEEEFFKYFQHMISVTSNNSSGIATMKVRAFRPDDALKVSLVLLEMGEQLVNRMNARIRRDAVAASRRELELNQKRLVESQIALASFRNRELMIDPVRNAASLSELIGKMSSELAQTRAELANMLSVSPINPQLMSLQRRATALEQQIATERGRITSSSDGLAERIATYDRLSLERDFANRMMIAAETELARARIEAMRQQLYLERIVEPLAPDYPNEPRRLAKIITTFAASMILFFVGWLIFAGVKEHGAERQ